jgi:hypothetical protein
LAEPRFFQGGVAGTGTAETGGILTQDIGIRVDWLTFWGATLFLLVGGGFAGFGGYQLWSTHIFLKEAGTAKAIVIENPESCDDDGECTWWPLLQFSDATGAIHERKTKFGASNYSWGEGSEIDILYNPSFPYVRVPGNDNLYLLGGAFLALGMLPVAISVWLLSKWTFAREDGRSG